MIRNTMRAAMTAACLIGMTSLASLAASAFEGVWKVKDTAGRPFEITLSSGGGSEGDPRRGNDRHLERRGQCSRDYVEDWVDHKDHE
jgi:hypothetical protein